MLVLLCLCACTQESRRSTYFVFDEQHLLTDSQATAIDTLYQRHARKTMNPIVLCTIGDDDHGSKLLRSYAVELFNSAGIGRQHADNGILMVLCIHCRRIEIITGRGTEMVVSDHYCQRLLRELILPRFREGKFYEGIYDGSKELIRFLELPGNEVPVLSH